MEGKEVTNMVRLTLWGGYSYSVGEPEEFDSWAAARLEYLRRRRDPYYPLWGDADPDDYVIVDEYEGLRLSDVLRDHDWCSDDDECGALHR